MKIRTNDIAGIRLAMTPLEARSLADELTTAAEETTR